MNNLYPCFVGKGDLTGGPLVETLSTGVPCHSRFGTIRKRFDSAVGHQNARIFMLRVFKKIDKVQKN